MIEEGEISAVEKLAQLKQEVQLIEHLGCKVTAQN